MADKGKIVQKDKVVFSAPEVDMLGVIFYNLTGRNFRDKNGKLDLIEYKNYLSMMKRDCGVVDGPVQLLDGNRIVARGCVG